MSETLSRPDAKTIALGGVATGKANAREEARATGIMKIRGLMCRELASSATIGIKMEAATVLLQMLVTATVTVTQMVRIANSGNTCNCCSTSPIRMLK